MCYTFVTYVNTLLSRRWWRRQWQPTLVLLPGKIPWTEEPGRQQSMGSHRVRHNWSSLAAAARMCNVTSHSINWATHSDFLPKSTVWKAGRGVVRRDRTLPHLGELFQLAPFSYDIPQTLCFCLSTSSFSGTTKFARLICVFPAPILESAISPWSPGSFYWGMVLETKIC